MFDKTPESALFDFSTATDIKAVQDTILAGFDRLAELHSELEGQEVTRLDIIDGFVNAYQEAMFFAALGGLDLTALAEDFGAPAEETTEA